NRIGYASAAGAPDGAALADAGAAPLAAAAPVADDAGTAGAAGGAARVGVEVAAAGPSAPVCARCPVIRAHTSGAKPFTPASPMSTSSTAKSHGLELPRRARSIAEGSGAAGAGGGEASSGSATS